MIKNCINKLNDKMVEINLHQGDCLELMHQIPDGGVDLVVTDPPYKIETTGAGIYKSDDKRYVKELKPISKGFKQEILNELVRVMDKINIYLFCSQKQLPEYYDFFVKQKRCNWNLLTWHKTNPVPACGNKYLSDTEYIFFAREKGVRINGNYHTKFTYYVTPLNQKEKKLYGHPTIKPTSIIDNLIINSCPEGGTVLDPFMGSGSTGVSAINQGCNFIGYELEQKYFETAQQRIKDTLSKKGKELIH